MDMPFIRLKNRITGKKSPERDEKRIDNGEREDEEGRRDLRPRHDRQRRERKADKDRPRRSCENPSRRYIEKEKPPDSSEHQSREYRHRRLIDLRAETDAEYGDGGDTPDATEQSIRTIEPIDRIDDQNQPSESHQKRYSRELCEIDDATERIRDEINPDIRKIRGDPQDHLKQDLRFPIDFKKIIDDAEAQDEDARGEQSVYRSRHDQMLVDSESEQESPDDREAPEAGDRDSSRMPVSPSGPRIRMTENRKREEKRERQRRRKSGEKWEEKE